MSKPRVEREEAVGDAIEVVDLLDVRAGLGSDPPSLDR
jgi:hypothetical protein